jgi:hypothetical protein
LGARLRGKSIQYRHHVFAAQALTDFDGQCFATEEVNHGQRSKAGAVKELIGYEVQTSDIVRGVNYRARLSSSGHD